MTITVEIFNLHIGKTVHLNKIEEGMLEKVLNNLVNDPSYEMSTLKVHVRETRSEEDMMSPSCCQKKEK